jgi:hypothetical protein
MKKSGTLLSLFFGCALTLALSSQVASACLLIIHSKDRRGDMTCQYTSEDADWCYYNCTCTGNCDQLYADFGLEEY